MTSRPEHLSLITALRVVLVAVLLSGTGAHAQQPANPELLEMKMNLQAASNRTRELEARLQVADRQQQATATALASANESLKEVTGRYENMRAALSGVGAAAILSGQNEETQQNLLAALAELKVAKERIAKLESAIQGSVEKLALPAADKEEVAKLLAEAITGKPATATASVVAATRPEQGLAIVTLGSGVSARAGAKVLIATTSGDAVAGVIVEAREGAACVSLEQGLGLNRTIEIGAPVEFSITPSSKL